MDKNIPTPNPQVQEIVLEYPSLADRARKFGLYYIIVRPMNEHYLSPQLTNPWASPYGAMTEKGARELIESLEKESNG